MSEKEWNCANCLVLKHLLKRFAMFRNMTVVVVEGWHTREAVSIARPQSSSNRNWNKSTYRNTMKPLRDCIFAQNLRQRLTSVSDVWTWSCIRSKTVQFRYKRYSWQRIISLDYCRQDHETPLQRHEHNVQVLPLHCDLFWHWWGKLGW